jgi:hypothetical protein
MGFDKPDLGFVVHVGSPSSPIAYYQQVGRAGRGVDHAEVLLLPGQEDASIWRCFASLAFPPEEQVRRTLDILGAADRPVGVVSVASRRHGLLVDSLSTRISAVGRIPLLGRVDHVEGGEPGGVPRSNSAQRVRALHEAFAPPGELAATLGKSPGPALLVDDVADTGWTLAVVARLLRRAGTTVVFPLVLAVHG